MQLKPHDLAVVLKVAASRRALGPVAEIASSLDLSASETHKALGRASAAQLISVTSARAGVRGRPQLAIRVNRAALVEFATHGARYVFLPDRGPETRGMPTGRTAPPMNAMIGAEGPALVWPDPKGTARGEAWEPLYPGALYAARTDPALYELLALMDGLRSDSPRDREFAAKLFSSQVREL